jgi:hypothetical protein
MPGGHATRAGRLRVVPLVTLSTDIGWEYAAQMKAVLARGLPFGHIVDLSHEIRPHAVREAAFLLRHMAADYPAGTIHVAIVDPGVGGSRAPVALECRNGSFLVGPDNGVLWPLARTLGFVRAVRLRREQVGVTGPLSPTFQGRDLFAPAAVALANGSPLSSLGPAQEPSRVELPRPRRTPRAMIGELVHIDRFGNLITNLPAAWDPPGRSPAELVLSRRAPRRLARARSYSDLEVGELGLLVSSFGLLEVAQREGSAAERLGAETGERVELRPAASPARA